MDKPQTEQRHENLEKADTSQSDESELIQFINHKREVKPDRVQHNKWKNVSMEKQRSYIVESNALNFLVETQRLAGDRHVDVLHDSPADIDQGICGPAPSKP